MRRNLLVVEGLCSAGSTLLTVGIFFYTSKRFGWGMRENFCLATAQGCVYVIGALLANRLTQRLGRRRALTGLYLAMASLTAIGLLPLGAAAICAVLLGYTLLTAATWPALESLVTSGAASEEMSRRIGIYNLMWAGTSAAALAVNGTIIEVFRPGVFLFPLLAHGLSAVIIWPGKQAAQAPAAQPETAQVHANAALLSHRRLALWLSRLALPATYMVIYSLSAVMPSLPAVAPLSMRAKTAAASVWMVSRWLTFLVLGITTAWHAKPKLLLWSALVMFVAFLGTVIRPTDLLASTPGPTADLLAMLAWQIPLGVALGAIYTASLYFGMVLSQGSTEHGGYHEALIGLGSVLGPGAGAVSLFFFNDLRVGLGTVAAVVGASVFAAVIANLRLRGAEDKQSKADHLEHPAEL